MSDNADYRGILYDSAEALLRTVLPDAKVEETEPGIDRRYFACIACNGNVVCDAGSTAACACGKVRVDWRGSGFSVTGYARELTDFVVYGKLTAAEPEPGRVVFAVNNRPARAFLVSESGTELTARDKVKAAARMSKDTIRPAFDYVARAAQAGAAVLFRAHYHTQRTGIVEAPSGKYFQREVTGDARFVCEVVVRDQKNESDGSLIFKPVTNCARCGSDHRKALTFWKLTNPVTNNGTVIASHFAFCPKTGEPILMVSSEPLAPEIDFTGVAPTGVIEGETMEPIGRAEPFKQGSFEPSPLTPASSAYDEGFAAGSRGQVPANPYEQESAQQAQDWMDGFRAGERCKHGN